MSAEERFNKFFEALMQSNQIWADGLGLVFPNKDVKLAAKKVWLVMHSEGKITKNMDWKEARQLMQKELTWQDPKNPDGFEKAVPVEIHPKAIPFGPERDEWLKKFAEAVAKVGAPVTERSDPYKEVRENWKAPEGQKYHPPSAEEIALLDLKVQYGRLHTDKLTGKRLEGSPKFEDWLKEQQ